jgi:cell wall-associated NlpC family hydrolase
VPYLWGGEHPCSGYDCSGLVQEILAAVGIDPIGDQSAQKLYEHFLVRGRQSTPRAGALCFYGSLNGPMSHVAFMIDENRVIEAGGGNAETTDIQKAVERKAFVRVRPYQHRQDLKTIIMTIYPSWVNL